MDILSLISNSTGNSYKKKASTNGGEYSGSCPWCSGEDRFSIHPANNHYVCRQCKKAGDSISFLMDYEHKSYPQACVLLDMPFERKKPHYSSSLNSVNGSAWKPRLNASPDLVWHQKAASYLFQCFKFLMSAQPEAKEHRQWLNERGISNDLIKKARFGWNAQSVSFTRESWGLAVDENEPDKNKQIWIPAGLLIPYFENEKLIRLRIRQANPESTNRFILVTGSSMNYLNHSRADMSNASQIKEQPMKPETVDIEKNKTVMVVESELDGWLIHDYAQQAGIPLTVLSIGNVTARPEQSAHELISNADKVFLCLDNDQPGDTETLWWKQQYPHVIDARMPVKYGKDPGEAFKAGLDLKSWLTDCVKSKNSNRESFFNAVASQIDEESIKKEQPLQEHSPIPDPAALTKKTEQQVKPEFASKTCIHGHFCSSAKDNICLKTDEHFFDMQECPQKQWYVHEDGPVKLIIFGFGFKKMRRA